MKGTAKRDRKCPNCTDGYILGYGYFRGLAVPCDVCDSKGTLPEGMVYDPEAGRNLREERHKAGQTLRQWALENHASVAERSRLERGFFPGRAREAAA